MDPVLYSCSCWGHDCTMFVDSRLYLKTFLRWLIELQLTNSDQVVDVSKHRIFALIGLYLMGFYNVSWVLAMSLISSNTAGATKKSLGSASMGIFYGSVNPFPPFSLFGASGSLGWHLILVISGGKYHWSSILPWQPEAPLQSRNRCYDLLLPNYGSLWYTLLVSICWKCPLWSHSLLTIDIWQDDLRSSEQSPRRVNARIEAPIVLYWYRRIAL